MQNSNLQPIYFIASEIKNQLLGYFHQSIPAMKDFYEMADRMYKRRFAETLYYIRSVCGAVKSRNVKERNGKNM